MNHLEAATLAALARLDRELHPELTVRERLRAYAGDPGRMALEVFDTRLWRGQLDLLNATLAHRRIACVSGQKIGKTTALALLSLWLYCLGWRVFATTPTEHQLNNAYWREVRRLLSRAKLPIPGARDIHQSARGGLHDKETLAHIIGLLGRDVEALQGMSGSKMAFLVDEASGVDDKLIEAIKGNLVGGGLLVMTGNPTRNAGEFYEAFTRRRASYKTFEISSLDVPQGADAIPGLATRAECEAFRQEYGEDSPFYQVRVLGKFVVGQEGCIIPVGLIEAAHAAWNENDIPDDPWLVIGCDVAGPGGDGDESTFAPKRGARVLELVARRSLTTHDHIIQFEQLFDRWGREGDKLALVIDREGDFGKDVYYEARRRFDGRAWVLGFRGSNPARRQKDIYDRWRDEAPAWLAKQARDGNLALPPDVKLDQELNAFKLEQQLNGKFKTTSKKDLRKHLGRSPDRADAVIMACWWEPYLVEEASRDVPEREDALDPYEGKPGSVYDQFDPYSGV